jgi:soluble lytic murein transglycosylase-like protein
VDAEIDPPSSYRPSSRFDPVAGRKALARFADDFASAWPELRAISDLASVGLYDLSGPMLSDWHELWRQQLRRRDRTAKRLAGTAPEAWQQLFLSARDHHDVARSLYGLWETLPPNEAIDALRLGYPLAHDRYVWTHAREYDLDPFLVLGLMRQESTYNSTARSRVGARGAMQIMPKTGHLLADLAHDTHFDAGDLEDPTVAVGYGIRYLGLLMERFDGVYPLAVASYNGGPFNVSAWLRGAGPETSLDAFVEHIPYRETRDYVKKVSEGYAAYVELYGPERAALRIPPRPTADRVEVVDF